MPVCNGWSYGNTLSPCRLVATGALAVTLAGLAAVTIFLFLGGNTLYKFCRNTTYDRISFNIFDNNRTSGKNCSTLYRDTLDNNCSDPDPNFIFNYYGF